MRVQVHNYPFFIYYLTSSPGCFRSILYRRLNVKRTFLMNFKPVLCWEAAWYDICHNTFIRTGETERAGQQVCFSSKVHPSLTTFFTLQIPSFLALCFQMSLLMSFLLHVVLSISVICMGFFFPSVLALPFLIFIISLFHLFLSLPV